MARLQNIERPSKGSKNLSSPKGEASELSHSIQFHSRSIPILVSPIVLRQRNLGQIDLLKLFQDKEGWMIELAEVKSSQIGLGFLHKQQKMRLLESGRFIAGLLGARIKVTCLVG